MTMQNDTEENEKFEKNIKELDQFREKWSKYLNKVVADDTEATKSNEIALELQKEADLKMKQLDSFIFNDNKIFFENINTEFQVGSIKFERISRKFD